MISEIRIATLSVGDLDRSLRFYTDGLGYRELDRGPVPAEVAGPWRVPAGLTGHQVVLSADDGQVGMLRLVAFDAPGEPIFERVQDAGHYAANFRVRDIQETMARLVEHGAQPPPWRDGPIEPHHWVLHDVEVWDSMFRDPDGSYVDVYQIVKGPPLLGELEGEVSPIETMAVHTVDAPTARAFYEGLGYRVWYEQMVDPQPFLGMPPGSQLHNVNLMMRGDVVPGRVELAQRIGQGDVATLEDRAVPPNRGYLSVSFESDNVDADAATALALGAREISRPVDVQLPALGRVRLTTLLGPDGEALELYQRL
jgi:catechol 2,3-dioxygenase-like lactoylglutathione lyase family enzyme